MHKTISELMLKGTTTVRAISVDSVVLASDTRVTMGSLTVHKLDDFLVMAISGAVADSQRTGEISKVNSGICRPLDGGQKRQVLADC